MLDKCILIVKTIGLNGLQFLINLFEGYSVRNKYVYANVPAV